MKAETKDVIRKLYPLLYWRNSPTLLSQESLRPYRRVSYLTDPLFDDTYTIFNLLNLKMLRMWYFVWQLKCSRLGLSKMKLKVLYLYFNTLYILLFHPFIYLSNSCISILRYWSIIMFEKIYFQIKYVAFQDFTNLVINNQYLFFPISTRNTSW